MLVMAIEAITLVTTGRDIVAYEIRDTAFVSALSIPPDEAGVDVQFVLRPSQDSNVKDGSWASFSLFRVNQDNIVEICRGVIKAIPASKGQHGHEEELKNQAQYTDGLMSSVGASDSTHVPAAEFYSKVSAAGVYYGPAFQRIENIRGTDKGQAAAEISIYTPADLELGGNPCLIHPATLDSLFQMAFAPSVVSGTDTTSARIPSYVSRMRMHPTPKYS